jgi:hypothetical protein
MSGVGLVSRQLVKTFAICRTKAKMNPPAAVPQISEAHTQSQFSVALGARLHGCSLNA